MICPSCGYETFHPKAVNCDLCAAPLHPEKGGGAPAGGAGGDLEAMANLVAEAETAPAKPKGKPAKTDDGGKTEPKATDSAVATIAPTLVAAAEATQLGPVDLLLFLLALPVTFPVAAWGLIGGNTRQIATWIWMLVSLLFLGGGLALAASAPVGSPLLYLPLGLGAAVCSGGLLLLRQGEPKPAQVTIALAILGGLAPLVVGPRPGTLAESFERSHVGLVQCLAATQDGSVVVSGASDAEAIVWDAPSGLPLFRLNAHKKALSAVWVVDPAHLVVTAGWDGLVFTWDLQTGEARSQFETGSARGVSALVVRPQGDQLVYGTPLGRVVFSPVANHEPVELGSHPVGVSALAITRKGDVVASAASDGSIIVWDMDLKSAQFELPEAHERSIRALGFTDDNRLISASYDRTIKVWSSDGELIQTLQIKDQVRSLTVRGDRAATTHGDRSVSLWSIAGEVERTGTFDLGEGKSPPAAVAFSSTGEAVLVADDKDVRVVPLDRFAQ